MKEFQQDKDEITTLTAQLHTIIDHAVEEDYFGVEELNAIQNQMSTLIKQGMFWLKQGNQERFIYDLKECLKWLINYVEIKEGEQ